MNRLIRFLTLVACLGIATQTVLNAGPAPKAPDKAAKPEAKPPEKAAPQTNKPPDSATNAPAPRPEPPPAADTARPKSVPGRIAQPINEGSVTADDINKIKAEHKYIVSLGQFRSSGKLSADETKRFRQAIADSCPMLFAEQQRPDGSTLQFYRFGVNVVLREDTGARLAANDFSPDELLAWARDFCRLFQLKVLLASEGLREGDRAARQAEYNELLNKYFALQSKPAKEP